jgi:PTS system galactitol-specific IIB component
MKKILVACGTAVATSTVLAAKLGALLKARGIDVTIDQCKASEVGAKAAAYDLIVSTTEIDDPRGKPHVRTLSFLTGVGIDADVARIVALLGR